VSARDGRGGHVGHAGHAGSFLREFLGAGLGHDAFESFNGVHDSMRPPRAPGALSDIEPEGEAARG